MLAPDPARKAGFLIDGDANFLSHSHEDMEILLHAYLMEKAVYELGYEMNNRPDWINIPLAGIEQLLHET